MVGGGVVWDYCYWQVGCMGWIVVDFDVQYSGQVVQVLCVDVQCIDFFIQFQVQFFDVVGGIMGLQFGDVDWFYQCFFGQQYCFFGGVINVDVEYVWWVLVGVYGWYGFQYLVDDGVGWVEYGEFGFCF